MPEPVSLETFRHTAWSNRADLKRWDLYTAAGLAVVASVLANHPILASLPDLYLAEVTAIAALFGFIIAGLAVMVAFLDNRFLALVRKTGSGIVGALWPFWLVSALAVVAISFSAAGIVLAAIKCETLQRFVFGVTTLFASWALFCSLRLVQYIVSQGVNRALHLDTPEPPDLSPTTCSGVVERDPQDHG